MNGVENFDYYFINPNYKQYIVEYEGDIKGEVEKVPGYHVLILDEKYAVVATEEKLEINYKMFKSIFYVMYPELYTLQDIKLNQENKSNVIDIKNPLDLTGNKVMVAVIGTGIDYLSNTFITEDGKSRIELIWDQTIPSNGKSEDKQAYYGSIYTNEMINNAISLARNGGNPYSIVPSIDVNGHGTTLASIIGGFNRDNNFKGIASKCSFIVIKLKETEYYKNEYQVEIPIYNLPSIYIALKFLYEYKLKNLTPIVIYFPLGTNSGNHKGSGILEEYIELISMSRGVVVVSGTGNEGANGGHASGIIKSEGEMKIIQLDVNKRQKILPVEIWIDAPNFMTIEVVSPAGESTGLNPSLMNFTMNYKYILEETNIEISYFIPEQTSGDELIRVTFHNLVPGIWQFRIIGKLIINGTFNLWLPQRGIRPENTRFSPSDPYNTITNPSNSKYTVTVASYNERNNNIVNFSGVASLDEYLDVIDLAAPGVNILSIAPGNKITLTSGTAASAAVVAGVCALLLEWGIIEGNDLYIYSQKIKAYLERGTYKRKGDIYPNPQWGYGILNVFEIFRSMI
ncbi:MULTISPECIES: S8 family peptidase [unclassified Clostridium]|uniref:S8 family peptidase n=1 Tax=unclassified Clostridium TaxID=2614128 RepID=UPI00189B8207|nr:MULTISPECIES: S8 family peptidase [unclassified Clostridium]